MITLQKSIGELNLLIFLLTLSVSSASILLPNHEGIFILKIQKNNVFPKISAQSFLRRWAAYG